MASVITSPSATDAIADQIKMRNELVRQGEYNERSALGGYRVLGRLIELRHEIARDGNEPEREQTKVRGVSMDWRHFHNGPLIGLDKTRSQILFIEKVTPLPDLPDPSVKAGDQLMVETDFGMVPAASIFAAVAGGSKVAQEQLDKLGLKTPEDRPMIKQRFVDHMRGTWGEKFMVCGPLTQALYKVDGVIGMSLIDFASDTWNKTSPTFFLDPATGEGHILGGRFLLR